MGHPKSTWRQSPGREALGWFVVALVGIGGGILAGTLDFLHPVTKHFGWRKGLWL